MKISIINTTVISLLLLLSINTQAQEEEVIYDDTISVTEWLDGMELAKESGYTLKNTWVKFDDNGVDSNLIKWDVDSVDMGGGNWRRVKVVNFSELNLKSELNGYITNCKFSGIEKLVGLKIGYLTFQDCNFSRTGFDGFNLNKCTIKRLHIFNCTGPDLIISESEVLNGIFFSGCKDLDILLKKNTFLGYGLFGVRATITVGYGVYPNVIVDDCKFNLSDSITQDSNDVYVSIDFENANIKNLTLINMDVFSLNLEDATISKSIFFYKLNIQSFISAKNLDIPESNSNMNWSIIGGSKLSFNDGLGMEYKGNDSIQLSSNIQFTELLSIYQKMLNLYKERGDRQSFNACYVEMRDLQTDRLHYDYTQDKTLNSLFNWRMNQFLKTFCDFGTNPVKPLIISMWVILGFGFMYFFFYNEWDKVNRQFLIKQHRKMLQYFSSEQKLEDFYTDEYIDDFKSYEAYKNEIDETNLHVPFFIRILGKPLYKMSLVRFKIMTWLYRSTEVLQGKWSDLTKGRKAFVGVTVGSGIVVYLVFLIAIRLLNSVVLSINTFSTLGFGDIPVKGVMKYMAILEGFLGWFLLSIFSVSLISQILPA